MCEDVYELSPVGEDQPNAAWQFLMVTCGARRASELFQQVVIEALFAHGLLRLQRR